MKTKMSWAHLHAPLFLTGATGQNLGDRLDPSKRFGLVLEFCDDTKHLYVTYKGTTIRVPEASIFSMVEGDAAPAKAQEAAQPNRKIVAQVGTPQSHVHAGAGAGDTGQAKPKMKF